MKRSNILRRECFSCLRLGARAAPREHTLLNTTSITKPISSSQFSKNIKRSFHARKSLKFKSEEKECTRETRRGTGFVRRREIQLVVRISASIHRARMSFDCKRIEIPDEDLIAKGKSWCTDSDLLSIIILIIRKLWTIYSLIINKC